MILNLEAETWSDEESLIKELDEEEEVEQYYQKLLESEYKQEYEYGIADLNGTQLPPSYLAIVMVKIQGSILKCPCTMLIDTGSKLNIMMSEHASVMELPVDPAGAAWTL